MLLDWKVVGRDTVGEATGVVGRVKVAGVSEIELVEPRLPLPTGRGIYPSLRSLLESLLNLCR